ncbi:MAG: DUF805 domain-containing protein [Prevotella sp.]|nr:DUF805 domain-containing protein [Prevotella sp.]
MEQITATPSLGFSEAINKAASNIFKFEGRSRRSEYWWTMVIVYLVSIILTPLVGFVLSLLTIPLTFRRLHDTGRSGWWWGGCAILQGIVTTLFIYDMTMAYLNADNMNGYGDEIMWAFLLKYSLLSVLIVIYKIVLIVFYCIDSEPYKNDYGESPKHEISADAVSE